MGMASPTRMNRHYQSELHFGKIDMKYCLLLLVFASHIACSRQGIPKLSPQEMADRALLLAASSNDVEGMKRALKSGANINSTTPCLAADTPLMCAAMQGHVEAVRFLIANKADLNRTNWSGTTALMYSALLCPENAIQLVKAGADVNIKDFDGRTALMNATDPEIKKLIKEAGGKEIDWVPPGAAKPPPTSGPTELPSPAIPKRIWPPAPSTGSAEKPDSPQNLTPASATAPVQSAGDKGRVLGSRWFWGGAGMAVIFAGAWFLLRRKTGATGNGTV